MTIELPRVTLRFRFSFFAVLTLMLLCGNEAVALCCFLSSALHECGHLLLLLLFRAFPEDVTFGAGGVVITRRRDALVSYGAECLIALGGIFMNALLSLSGLLLYRATRREIWLLLFWVNVFLPALNLLPVRSLDAWTALSALLRRNGDDAHAQKVLKNLSNAATILFVAFTVVYLIRVSRNISLAAVCVYLIVLNARPDSSRNGE